MLTKRQAPVGDDVETMRWLETRVVHLGHRDPNQVIGSTVFVGHLGNGVVIHAFVIDDEGTKGAVVLE